MGMFFNSFIRHAHIVKMANLAQIVNVIAPIFTNEKGLFLQPIYFPIAEYARQRGNQALDLWVTSPTYRTGNRAPLNYLDTSATFDRSTGTVFLNVLNRSEKLDITASIENIAGQFDSKAEVWEMQHTDLKATHTFGDDRKVRPVTRAVSLGAGNRASYVFPRHSLTILRLQVRP